MLRTMLCILLFLLCCAASQSTWAGFIPGFEPVWERHGKAVTTSPLTRLDDSALSPEKLYERGLELIQKNGGFIEGRQIMVDFLNKKPQSPLAVEAMYWIGEAYYGEKKFENAILQYQDVIEKYGNHPKVAAALLKQGMAFYRLGDARNGRTVMRKLIEIFPHSEEAKRSKDLLTEWDKSDRQKNK
jgi:tol-pal system protein YbgF